MYADPPSNSRVNIGPESGFKSVPEESDPKPETKDWLVEDFPVALRWRCKEAASHEHVPLKIFVQNVMLKAVEEAEGKMLRSADENRQKPVRRSSPPDAGKSPTKNRRNTQA